MSKMDKDLRLSVLLDIYGNMLTDKQRNVVELYYNEDLSLAEIAEHENITRQGVRDSIKRGEVYLLQLEDKLGLAQLYNDISKCLDDISSNAQRIKAECDTYGFSKEISEKSSRIIELATEQAQKIG